MAHSNLWPCSVGDPDRRTCWKRYDGQKVVEKWRDQQVGGRLPVWLEIISVNYRNVLVCISDSDWSRTNLQKHISSFSPEAEKRVETVMKIACYIKTLVKFQFQWRNNLKDFHADRQVRLFSSRIKHISITLYSRWTDNLAVKIYFFFKALAWQHHFFSRTNLFLLADKSNLFWVRMFIYFPPLHLYLHCHLKHFPFQKNREIMIACIQPRGRGGGGGWNYDT